jgi:hypothetical protein
MSKHYGSDIKFHSKLFEMAKYVLKSEIIKSYMKPFSFKP